MLNILLSVSQHACSQNFLDHYFSTYISFKVPNHPSRSFAIDHEIVDIFILSHVSFHMKWLHQTNCPEHCPLGGFSPHGFFWGARETSYSSLQFLIHSNIPTQSIQKSSLDFSLLCQLVIKLPHRLNTGVSWGRSTYVITVVWDMGSDFCSLLRLSSSAHIQPQTYHFPFKTECCCALKGFTELTHDGKLLLMIWYSILGST